MNVQDVDTAAATVPAVPASAATLTELRAVVFGRNAANARIDELIVQAHREGASLRDIAAIIGGAPQTVLNRINALTKGDEA